MEKPTWISVDSVTALVVIVVFTAYGLYGSTMESTLGVDYVGPDFFPEMISIFAVILGVVMLVQDRRRRAAKVAEVGEADLTSVAFSATILVPFLMLLVYVLSLSWVGFPIATVVFLTASARYLGCPSWLAAVLFGLLGTLAAVALFRYGLDLRLPRGVIVRFW